MNTILALDLGTTTGWATSINGVVTSGIWKCQPPRFSGGGIRFVLFLKHLESLHNVVGFDVVYFEEVRRHLGVDAAHIYGGFLAHLEQWCETRNPKIPYLGIPVGTIKKHATGKGNAKKDSMISAARERGWNPQDDNEADALWILDCALKSDA